MLDIALVNGDHAIFDNLLVGGMVTAPIPPGKIRGSSNATINKQKVCVEGDEDSVIVPNCPYIAGSFVIPGMGTFKIKRVNVNHDQIATKTNIGNKAALLKGSLFEAVFTVDTPAQQPNPPAPNTLDQVQKQYKGTGRFQSFNTIYKTT